MKRLMSVVLSMVVVLMMCCGAMAQECFNAQGSIVVPCIYSTYISASDWTAPHMVISNITDKEVQCKVKVFDQDGIDVTYLGYVFSGGEPLNVISSGIGDFDIPAYSTRVYAFNRDGGKKRVAGYATIEWKSDDTKLRNALVGGVFRARGFASSRSDSERLINNGQPF